MVGSDSDSKPQAAACIIMEEACSCMNGVNGKPQTTELEPAKEHEPSAKGGTPARLQQALTSDLNASRNTHGMTKEE